MAITHKSAYRHTRTRKAIDVMTNHVQGLIWVKLIEQTSHPLERPARMVPIRWFARQRVADADEAKDQDSSTDRGKEWACRPFPRIDSGDNCSKESPQTSEGSSATPSSPLSSAVSRTPSACCSQETDDLCIVCLARAPNFQLLPCRHDSFCRQCIVETICTWVRPEAPSCPLCRAAFHTVVLLD